jgi:5-methylthioadenosine/S-adenosylhomocysteine deaminase
MVRRMTDSVRILCPEWLICVDADNRVLQRHSVVVEGTQITAIEPRDDAIRNHPDATVVALDGHALMPGLVNAHTHLAMNLMRGFADDLPLMTWLNDHIWPTEARFVDRQFVADGSRLAMAESIRGGVTCFNDMYFFPDVVAETAMAVGMRASVGLIALDFPTVWASGPDEYLEKGLQLHQQLIDEPLVSCLFAPHAPYTVSAEPLNRIRQLGEDNGIGVHMHVHETAAEVQQFVEQHGVRPLSRLAELGLLNPAFCAVHVTQLTDDEIQQVAQSGCSVLHCPESNLKLASGIAPITALQNAGVNVAIGTDGAASNNDLDMFGEMRSAAFIAKVRSGDAAVLSATQVLRMGTINGARALGLGDVTGSIEVGKQADLVAVDFDKPELQPVFNPVSHLIYSANRADVSHVWVAGRQLLDRGELTALDNRELVANAKQWADKLTS